MTSLKGAIPRYSCNPSCETLGVIDAFLEGHGCCHGGQWDPKKIMRPDILKVHTRQSSSSKMINSSRRLCSLLQNPWRKQCGDHEFQAISSSISGVVFEEHMMRIGYDVINICKIVCEMIFVGMLVACFNHSKLPKTPHLKLPKRHRERDVPLSLANMAAQFGLMETLFGS